MLKASKRALTLLALIAVISGCGGGASTTSNPNTQASTISNYTGPAPATADVQAFKVNVWDNLRGPTRCGSCHGTGGQVPQFVRADDVNAAYSEANTVVDLGTPANSRLVTKVAGGHNCWLESDAACGAILTAYITAWAGGSVGAGGTQIELTAPPVRDAGSSKAFPGDATLFSTTVHPVLTAHCAGCHTSTSTSPQQPYFASSDLAIAYDAAKPRIDLDTPSNSRFVIRLRSEFHNCWSDCASDANAMEAAITSMANQISVSPVDPALVISKALRLTDGVVATGGNRFDTNSIARYQFKEGSGVIAYDTSGVEPALNLVLSGDVAWVGGWGIDIRDGKAQGSTTASRKLAQLIQATGEYSVEAWVVPGNVTQEGPARIISYSGGLTARNFTLGQTQYNYDFLNRSSLTDANGTPPLSTPDAAQVLQATQQHVVITFDPASGRKIYVNGALASPADTGGGSLADWDDTFALVLGNEVSNNRLWRGKLRFVSIYNRALTPAQIVQNFAAGVGEKYYLLFNVSQLTGVNQAYILFEVVEFDDYSYLFNRPVFISLDGSAAPSGIPLSGMRIGLNGKVPVVGQAYQNVNVLLGDGYSPSGGQALSTMGTVIAKERGADADEFFLSFERIGSHTNAFVEAVPLAPTPADLDPSSDIGVRTFDEVNASMAALTGVSSQNANVRATYTTIKQQLPSVENIEAFLSAHQVAVSQLAIEYCNALVEDTTLRASYFPGVNFASPAVGAFDTVAERNLVIDPLLTRVLGINVTSQPDTAAVKTELNNLIDRLTTCGASCAADRTRTVVKAVCSAALGSAAMLIQ